MTAETIIQSLASGLLMGLLYGLIAVGLALIFGLMDVVNFAHGELLMLAMYATFLAWQASGIEPVLLLPMVALLLFGIGMAIYRGLIARALSVQFNRGTVQIFVTFGLAIFLRGAALIVIIWRRSMTGAVLLLPYLLWITFAGYLNMMIVRLNGPFY